MPTKRTPEPLDELIALAKGARVDLWESDDQLADVSVGLDAMLKILRRLKRAKSSVSAMTVAVDAEVVCDLIKQAELTIDDEVMLEEPVRRLRAAIAKAKGVQS